MDFCVSVTRGGFHDGFCCPRKIGTNWFMPAFVNSRFGASGRSEDDGTMVCCFSRKKSRNDCRISADVMIERGINTNFGKLETATSGAGDPIHSQELAGKMPVYPTARMAVLTS